MLLSYEKRSTLVIARILCWAAIVIVGILFIAATALFISINVSPEAFAQVHFDGMFFGDGILNWQSIHTIKIDGQDTGDPFALSTIKPLSLFFLYGQCTMICLFMLLILREVMRMIAVTGQGKFVTGEHGASFRIIGRYLLAISLVSSFIWIVMELGEVFRVSVRLWPLVLTLAAYVLARSSNKRMTHDEAVDAGAAADRAR